MAGGEGGRLGRALPRCEGGSTRCASSILASPIGRAMRVARSCATSIDRRDDRLSNRIRVMARLVRAITNNGMASSDGTPSRGHDDFAESHRLRASAQYGIITIRIFLRPTGSDAHVV